MQFNQVENPRGNPLKINGQIWIFAPLSLGAAEKLMPKLKTFDPSDFALVTDVAHSSLKRNYPDITREFIADELLDVGHVNDVFETVMGASGLVYTGDEPQEGDSGE
ncbi:hypothetical protein FOB20_02200 [Acinetobacter lwoffii]|uniref:hypothetical protein n=1 Tax=Acinetobacter lwoffii TaxID=28090 RepID=UPI00158271FC|nr:hypothetical protein [Acinetobacter lwoffii]QKT97717.1 hypothetical protein FOB20_02200 [Acinetobacter lwoffii]